MHGCVYSSRRSTPVFSLRSSGIINRMVGLRHVVPIMEWRAKSHRCGLVSRHKDDHVVSTLLLRPSEKSSVQGDVVFHLCRPSTSFLRVLIQFLRFLGAAEFRFTMRNSIKVMFFGMISEGRNERVDTEYRSATTRTLNHQFRAILFSVNL